VAVCISPREICVDWTAQDPSHEEHELVSLESLFVVHVTRGRRKGLGIFDLNRDLQCIRVKVPDSIAHMCDAMYTHAMEVEGPVLRGILPISCATSNE
jgi:hypothetical protein